MKQYDLYARLSTYYGGDSNLNSRLSTRTTEYMETLTSLGSAQSYLTDTDKRDIQWLNRYILQDLYPDLTDRERDGPKFTASTLKDELRFSEEYTEREEFKTAVKDSVISTLESIKEDASAKETLLAELGLTGEKTIDINDNFLGALTEWMDDQDAHFGRSAFGTLKKMLETTVEVSLEEIAIKTLLVDILVGASGPMVDETIEISMFSMSRISRLYGRTTSTVRLDYEDLHSIDDPFVTLINGHHYVTILSVTETEVTYWDNNTGTSGGEVTISRDEFEDAWQGNVIASEEDVAAISEVRETEGDEAVRMISDIEAKKLKGAFFGLIIAAIVSFVYTAVATVITGAIAAIAYVMGTLVTLVGSIVTGLMNAVAGLGSLFTFVGEAFAGALGMGTVAAGETVVTGGILNTLVQGAGTAIFKMGVGYGTSVGLEALGVDPLVSGLIGSVVTGGVSGLIDPKGGLGLAFKMALQYGAAGGMTLLGQHFDFDPIITNILSMSTSILVGVPLDPEMGFADAAQTIATNVAGELTYYGVQTAGNAMGIDPKISMLAGIGIRSSLQAGLSGIGGGGSPGSWIDGAITGLSQGVTSIGLNYLVDEYDLNPLLANIGFSAISTAINGTLQSMLPGNENLDVFEFIYDTYEKNALTFFGVGASSDPWMEAAYIAQILDFTQIAKERGFVEAMNTYATGFFSSVAVNQMVTAAGSIGQYIKSKLDAGQFTKIELEDGTTAKKVDIENTDESALVEQLDGDFILKGKVTLEEVIAGSLGIDGQGKMGLLEGYISGEYVPGLGIYMNLNDGHQTCAEIRDPLTGDTLYYITPTQEGGYNYYDTYGDYVDARVKDVVGDRIFSLSEGTIDDFTFLETKTDEFTLSMQGYEKLLYSTVEDGKIVVDNLSKKSKWLDISTEAILTEDVSDELLMICDNALDKISYGETVDLYEIATQSEWQTILDNTTLMDNWSEDAINMFSSAVYLPLAPGTQVFTNILGDERFKQNLLDQANLVQNDSNYYREFAEFALNIVQPGSGTMVDSINTTSFWEGLKATAQTLWDKRNLIATTTSEVAQFITDPSKYVNDRFWTSDIGTQFMQEIGDYYGETNLTNQFLTIADNAATGGVVSVFETVGYDNLWTGVKEVSEFVWDNRNGIIGNVAEISSLVSNPYDYLWGKYLDTSTGKASQDQMLEFFGLKEPNTKVEIDYITKTVKVDPELNYGNIFERPVLGFLDGVMLLRTANFRYDRATYNAGLKCDGLGNDLLDGKIRGFSISGINTDGAKLDELTRDLAAAFLGTYSLTHSAGSSARIKSNVWTEKNIMISPQEKRIDVESWMDQMGYTSDNVLIVDVAGDLPYRPADVANIGLDDILNPATFVDTGFLAQNIVDIVKDNAYNDYSQNPNSKYTYVRIIDGSGIDYDLDIIENHSVGVDGALDLNAKYSISVNGLLLEGEHRLSDIYGKFLRGEL